MNIIFTCGGTAGHINPALAIADEFRKNPNNRILFIGAEGEMEEKLVPRAGYELKTLRITTFHRDLSFASIKHNLKAAWEAFASQIAAKKIIKEFHPDVIVGMGGFASYPAMRQGARMGVPTLVHEANAQPGLTTRMIARHADCVMVAFEESKRFYKTPDAVEVVGMPVQSSFIHSDRTACRAKLGIGDKPLVVSCWGSLGARDMNIQLVDFIRLESRTRPFYHVHAMGSFAADWMPKAVAEAGVRLDECPEIDLREYIYNMPELMVAADLVISRAGASTVNEIAASGTPSILVPSPNVTADHQTKNAMVLQKRGGSVLIPEKECSGKILYDTTVSLLNDSVRLAEMGQRAKSAAVLDSTDKIVSLILKAAGKERI